MRPERAPKISAICEGVESSFSADKDLALTHMVYTSVGRLNNHIRVRTLTSLRSPALAYDFSRPPSTHSLTERVNDREANKL